MRQKNFIKHNSSSYVASVLIVKKSNENLRIYVNYRTFNNVIIKNRNILLLFRDILVRLCQVKIYNKFDIIIAFNEIRIKFKHKKKSFSSFVINFSSTSLCLSIYAIFSKHFKFSLIKHFKNILMTFVQLI